ncbi:hypothetical protein LX36DRAFT_747252 [Colletotrichum falcatum]|nr:hypothetical protein LX36DRAFT_747252 [Colletotrichum falcatum]
MGLREALRGLVSKHDEGRLGQPATFCDDVPPLSTCTDFTTPTAKVYPGITAGAHYGEARIYKLQTESSPGSKVASPPAPTARSTTMTDSSVACSGETSTLCTENRYTLAEVAARIAFTDRYGDFRARARVVAAPPSPYAAIKPPVIVDRKPLPSESKSQRGQSANARDPLTAGSEPPAKDMSSRRSAKLDVKGAVRRRDVAILSAWRNPSMARRPILVQVFVRRLPALRRDRLECLTLCCLSVLEYDVEPHP